MEDLDYIKKFSKITMKSVCEKAKVDKSNVFNGKASKKKINKVKRQIESDIARLYLMEDEMDEKRESPLQHRYY